MQRVAMAREELAYCAEKAIHKGYLKQKNLLLQQANNEFLSKKELSIFIEWG